MPAAVELIEVKILWRNAGGGWRVAGLDRSAS
jgi:hypothetical protein